MSQVKLISMNSNGSFSIKGCEIPRANMNMMRIHLAKQMKCLKGQISLPLSTVPKNVELRALGSFYQTLTELYILKSQNRWASLFRQMPKGIFVLRIFDSNTRSKEKEIEFSENEIVSLLNLLLDFNKWNQFANLNF